MAAVTVFVDDAVRGRLPRVCVKDGVPTEARVRRVVEVGKPVGAGLMVLLLLLGPLGWLALVVLAISERGELLAVELPLCEAARARRRGARHLRNASLMTATLGVLFLLAFSENRITGLYPLVVIVVAVAVGAAIFGEWQLGRESVGVTLDASRRWVTLRAVHPAFSASCNEQLQERHLV